MAVMGKNAALLRLQEDLRLRNYSQSTMRSYTGIVSAFMDSTPLPVSSYSDETVRVYLLSLTDRMVAPQTYNVHHAALKFFFDVTLDKPFDTKKVPKMRLDQRLPAVLAAEDVSKLFSVCQSGKLEDLRYLCIFSLAYGSGLRISEILSLRIRDIDTKGTHQRLRIERSKNRMERWALLSDFSLRYLRKYWKAAKLSKDQDTLLFPGFSQPDSPLTKEAVNDALKVYLKKAGVSTKGVSMHTLRHSFGTHYYEQAGDFVTLKKLMGHKAAGSTLRYVHLAENFKGVESPLDVMMTDGSK